MNEIASTETRKRCAVSCRVATDERLDQEFNSIDEQKKAGHAYIASQPAEGWISVADDYDDPGFSGGNTDRPALKRLLADIEAGKIDNLVVYKIDRLTRSVADFSKMVEVFDRHQVSFSHIAFQHHHLDGGSDAQSPALLCPVRARGHRRAHPRQDRGVQAQGNVDGGVPPLDTPQAFAAESAQEREARAAAQESAWVRALGMAHHWQRLLYEGRFTSMTEIAQAEELNPGRLF